MVVSSIKPLKKSAKAYNSYIFGKAHNGKEGPRNELVTGVGIAEGLEPEQMMDALATERDSFPRGRRKTDVYTLIHSYSKDELDPQDPASIEKAEQMTREAIEQAYPGRSAIIAVQIDGKSGMVHTHSAVNNVDENGKALRGAETGWKHLKKATDEVSERHKLEPLTVEKDENSEYDWREDLSNRIEQSEYDLDELKREGVEVTFRKSKKYPPAVSTFAFEDRDGKQRRIRGRQLASQLEQEPALYDKSKFDEAKAKKTAEKATTDKDTMKEAPKMEPEELQKKRKKTADNSHVSDFERRNNANTALKAENSHLWELKKEQREEFSNAWGDYRDQMAKIKEEQAQKWTEEQQAQWDETAMSLRNASIMKQSALKQLGKPGNGVLVNALAVAFAIVSQVKERKYQEQLDLMKEQRDKLKEETQKMFDEAQAKKEERQQASKDIQSAIDEHLNENKADKQSVSSIIKRSKSNRTHTAEDNKTLENVELNRQKREENELLQKAEEFHEKKTFVDVKELEPADDLEWPQEATEASESDSEGYTVEASEIEPEALETATETTEEVEGITHSGSRAERAERRRMRERTAEQQLEASALEELEPAEAEDVDVEAELTASMLESLDLGGMQL